MPHPFPDCPPESSGCTLAVRRAPDGRFTLPSDDPDLESLFGFAPGTLRMDPGALLRRIHSDDLAGMERAIEDSLAGLEPLHLRWRYQHPERGWRRLESWACPRREPDGGLLWWGFVRDTTIQAEMPATVREADFPPARGAAGQPPPCVAQAPGSTVQKEAETRLKETLARLTVTEERLQMLLDHAPAALALFDRDMRYLAVSRRWLEDYHLPAADLLGRSHYDIFPEIPENWKAVHRRGLAGETLRAEEDRFLRLDGSAQWLRWEVRPWRTAEGGIGGIVIFSEDITVRKEAERAVQEAEERFRQISEAAQEWIWEVDADGLYTYASLAVERLLGYRPEALAGRVHYYDLWPEETRAELLPLAREAFRTHESIQSLPNVCLHQDGRRVLIETTGFPILGPDGGLLGYRGVDRDVTEREEAQRALRRSQERLEKAFQRNPMPMTISHLGSLRFLEVNDSWVELTGVPKETAIGRTIQELGLLEEATAGMDALETFRATGSLRQFPIRMVRPDGVSRDLLLSGEAVELAGEPCVVSSAEDITEQRRAEAAKRESEERFQELFEHAPIALWEEDLSGVARRFQELRDSGVTDLRTHLESHPEELGSLAAQARILSVNAASLKLMGVARPQDLVRDLPKYFTEESYAVLKQELEALFKGATRFEAETPHLDNQGRRLDLQLRFSVLPGHEADLSRALVSFIDLTGRKADEAERQRMEQELNHLQRLDSLGRLAGGISHDMNNVLAAILGMASSAEKQLQPTDPMAPVMDTIAKTCLRGRDVLKSLLVFTRRELGEARPIDLNGLVREAVDLLGHTTLKRARLALDLQDPLPEILGDSATLVHCLINLCMNSVDATPEGGTVTFRTRRHPGSGVSVSVRDTGAGMSPDVLEKAMEPFFTTKPQGKGTGLGLCMVYGAMQAHEGSVAIRSRVGEGTEVTLTFPESRLAGKPAAADLPGQGPAPAQALRILVVDDDQLVQASVNAMLKLLGHQATLVSSGEEALLALRDGLEVDLVLLDMNMPGMTGAGALPHLLALRPGLPVILASGFFDPSAAAIQEARPDVRLLQKPFKLAELEQGIGDVLRKRRQADVAGASAGAPEIRRILLVDDDEDVLILTSRMLRATGLELATAASGEEALQKLGAGGLPDLVILDQAMPGMDGIQTLAKIREKHPGLPVLISSGWPDIHGWACFKQPHVGVISKPFTVEEVMDKLKQFRSHE